MRSCFNTAAGTAFADLIIKGRRETWPIRSKRFRGWLRRGYYRATGGAASAAEIRSALDLLEARAQFDGPERPVHVRIAEHRPLICPVEARGAGSDILDRRPRPSKNRQHLRTGRKQPARIAMLRYRCDDGLWIRAVSVNPLNAGMKGLPTRGMY